MSDGDRPTEAPPSATVVARRYGDEEVAAILKRAADLHERSRGLVPGGRDGLTLAELRQVAAEAGIDPRFVDLAAADHASPLDRRENPFAGGAYHWHYHASVPGHIDDHDRHRILQAVRSVLGQKGEVAEVFGRMEWTYDDGVGPVIIGIDNREGRVEIDVTASRAGEAMLYHMLSTPVGGLFGGGVAAGVVGGGAAVALPLVLGAAGLTYMGSRLVWRLRSRSWERQLERVVEQITSIAQESGVSPPGEDGG